MTLLDAVLDPKLFAPWFKDTTTWRAWFAFLAALFGLEMGDGEAELYRRHTGRTELPGAPAQEAWMMVGRRGGKSRIAALIAVWLACFRSYEGVLSRGERGVVMVLAADRKQAGVIFRYVRAFLTGIPMLARKVQRETSEEIDLDNGITIAVHTSSYRSVRGYSIVAAICDEVAFWKADDSANPDVEVIQALRPGMATVPGALLIGLSSPYARRGVLWDAWRRHYGKDGSPVLVWKADTRAMNPTVSQSVIDRAYAEDPSSAAAEYGAEFRTDVEAFVSREAIEQAVVPGRHELPKVEGLTYLAFVDPSGGSRDSMTLAIAHREDERAVLDLVREVRPPFSPESVVAEFAEVLGLYGIGRVTGDRYGAEWVSERFRKAGVFYHPADKPKSDLYRELLPAVNSGRVELLDHPKLRAQLASLERRTARSGRDSIDHPPGGHDDVANVVAGVVHLVLGNCRNIWAEFYGPGSGFAAEDGTAWLGEPAGPALRTSAPWSSASSGRGSRRSPIGFASASG